MNNLVHLYLWLHRQEMMRHYYTLESNVISWVMSAVLRRSSKWSCNEMISYSQGSNKFSRKSLEAFTTHKPRRWTSFCSLARQASREHARDRPVTSKTAIHTRKCFIRKYIISLVLFSLRKYILFSELIYKYQVYCEDGSQLHYVERV